MGIAADQIVRILQVGTSGFAFLLVLLAYNIIRKEQNSKASRPAVLRTARVFLYQCIGLLVVVGLLQATERLFGRTNRNAIAGCRDAFDLLDDRKQRATEIAHARAAIDDVLSACRGVMEDLERQR